MPNILITTGSLSGYSSAEAKTSEVVNLSEDLICPNLPNYPVTTDGVVGGTLGSTPIVCGGFFYQQKRSFEKCYGYSKDEWKEFATMNQRRGYAAAVVFRVFMNNYYILKAHVIAVMPYCTYSFRK